MKRQNQTQKGSQIARRFSQRRSRWIQRARRVAGAPLFVVHWILVALAAASLATPAGHAAVFEQVIHSFGATDNPSPIGPLVEGKDGALYGTTFYGGPTNTSFWFGVGMVFRVNKDGTSYKVLHMFDPNRVDEGALPQGRLLEATDGVLYGTCSRGGITNAQNPQGFGTVFKLSKDGSGYSVLYRFQGFGLGDGQGPVGGVMEGLDGALYGTTSQGGSGGGAGAVFRINKDGSNYAFIYDGFGGLGGADSLLQGSDGALYGTTSAGCIGVCGFYSGDVFTLNIDGSGFAELYCFLGTCVGDGDAPTGLVEGRDGALYGSTSGFGNTTPGGSGETVFTINRDGSGYNILHSFGIGADGYFPQGGVIEGSDGALYGAILQGGITNEPYYGPGAVFRLNKDGSGYTLLYSFPAWGSGDAYNPSSLIEGSDGAFYGTSGAGGDFGHGTVFRISFTPPPPVLHPVTRTGHALALAWSAFSGGTYQLQYTTNLVQTNWTDLGNPVTTTNSTGAATDTLGPDWQRFYRVVLLP